MTEQRFDAIEKKIDDMHKRLFLDENSLAQKVTRLEAQRTGNKELIALIISITTLLFVGIKTFAGI